MNAKSLEQQVADLAVIVADHAKVIGALRGALGGGGSTVSGGEAPDSELDSQYGDGKVRFNVKKWKGTQRKGHQMSRCEADFLDVYAETLETIAKISDEEGKTYKGQPASKFDRIDARRARGWARRLREGWQPPAAAEKPAGATWGKGGGWGGNRGPDLPPAREEPATAAHDPATGEVYDDFASDAGGDDEIPFLSSSDVTPRHLRRRTLWERF